MPKHLHALKNVTKLAQISYTVSESPDTLAAPLIMDSSCLWIKNKG